MKEKNIWEGTQKSRRFFWESSIRYAQKPKSFRLHHSFYFRLRNSTQRLRRKLCAVRIAEKLRTNKLFHSHWARVRASYVKLCFYFSADHNIQRVHSHSPKYSCFVSFISSSSCSLLIVCLCVCVRVQCSSSSPAKLLGCIDVRAVNWCKVEKVIRIDKVVCL